ncbi:helix-turn-helix transcriptional regulator, partial [Lentzea sp.]|uniref:helix-turn-helix domain-containing protein n=1 Tax=Lentzea sp. TaxID=56099 RepID=UPI002ED5CDC4
MDATGPANAAENPLGAFLRARRELADPAEIGVPPIGRRRTPGLRREEVATLAGISAAYYTRLEQGRDANPSPQVIEALAHVLGLDSEARAYLRGLVADAPASRPVRPAEAVSHRLTQLLDRWSGEAVIVVGRFRDVLAANALAVALNPGYRPGRNL